eukprot:TRINITY_DN3767_c0_g1_i2.p1 TRINITY_DN3767_c0_g1~~TRINITY_DN3767_c0_g1_i2.p1  ORF type:complete len:213 (-),score=49.42 TRINITY_DN3767_c0_g1_i2:152-790(-)
MSSGNRGRGFRRDRNSNTRTNNNNRSVQGGGISKRRNDDRRGPRGTIHDRVKSSNSIRGRSNFGGQRRNYDNPNVNLKISIRNTRAGRGSSRGRGSGRGGQGGRGGRDNRDRKDRSSNKKNNNSNNTDNNNSNQQPQIPFNDPKFMSAIVEAVVPIIQRTQQLNQPIYAQQQPTPMVQDTPTMGYQRYIQLNPGDNSEGRTLDSIFGAYQNQ